MRTKTITAIITTLLFFTACGSNSSTAQTVSAPEGLPLSSYMVEESAVREVCDALKNAGLKNVDTYESWVKDFAGVAGEKANLSDGWVSPDALSGDPLSCADFWEATYDYSDSDCRMTAMLLMGDLVRAETTDTYQGTYLMFDVDAIENVEKYALLKEREDLFTTLFGEMQIPGSGFQDTLPHHWKEHGIRFDSDTASLISVVIHDPYDRIAFVGHTGILVNMGNHYLFVEKLAFEQPYQATRLGSMDDLMRLFSARAEYFGEEGAEDTLVYQNDTLIGKLE